MVAVAEATDSVEPEEATHQSSDRSEPLHRSCAHDPNNDWHYVTTVLLSVLVALALIWSLVAVIHLVKFRQFLSTVQ